MARGLVLAARACRNNRLGRCLASTRRPAVEPYPLPQCCVERSNL